MFIRFSKHQEIVAAKDAEIRRLTDIVVGMKRAGFEPNPTASDPAWEDGKYVMEEQLPSEFNEQDGAAEDPELARMTRSVLDHVFRPNTNPSRQPT